MLKDVRVPGVVWAVALIAIIALIHENEATLQARYGLEPFYLDMLVAVLIGILKSLSLGTEQLNAALDIIDKLLARRTQEEPEEHMRSSGIETVPEIVETVPDRPNQMVRWLFG